MQSHVLPEKITCSVTSNTGPVMGLMIWVRPQMMRKNAYALLFGPTDQNGNITITYDEILDNAYRDLEMALMDYLPIDQAFSGSIIISVMTKEEIQNAVGAYNEFKRFVVYPPNYLENLNMANEVLGQLDTSLLHLSVSVTPESIRVIVK